VTETDRTQAKLSAVQETSILEAARERIQQLEEAVRQLQTALDSRIVIEQAKGILAERLAVDVDQAFDILRYAARSHSLKLHDVAESVIKERETPAPVIAAIARQQRARAAWMREVAEAHVARVRELQAALQEQLSRVSEPDSRQP
jgi:ANTAR domain